MDGGAEKTVTHAPDAVWEPLLNQLAAENGAVLLLGGPDRGKTTFARCLAARMAAHGQPSFFIDADLGQSEIGPPCCVGMGVLNMPDQSLAETAPSELIFVGDNNPVGARLEYISALLRASQLAAGPCVIDTGGYALTEDARRLNRAIVQAVQPQHIVALQRGNELEPLLNPLRPMYAGRLHTPPVPAELGVKPVDYRAQRRSLRLAAAFENSRLHRFDWRQTPLAGTWLGNGTPLPAHLLVFVRQCFAPSIRVYYAETWGQELGLMVSAMPHPDAPARALVLQQLKKKSLVCTVAPQWKNLLVGLEGPKGRLLGLGLIEELDFRRTRLGVLTAVRTPEAALTLRPGILRLLSNGAEIGRIA